MKKDNSKISKEIINLIIKRDLFPNLTEEQIKVIRENIPAALKSAESDSLIKNSRIKGDDDKIYKINFNELSPWVSFTGSQKGFTKIMQDMDIVRNVGNSPEEDLFQIISERGVNAYVSQMLTYMSVDDFWILINEKITNIDIFDIDELQFEFEALETDILSDREKKTWFIKWNGKNLFQIQSGTTERPKSPIFRINKKFISEFLVSAKHNTETWGISVEVALCELNSIQIPDEYNKKRYDTKLVAEASAKISSYFKDGKTLPSMTKCLATKLNGKKKSPTDFMANNLRVSVKTNYNGNTKVCAPDVGQPGIKEGIQHYNRMMGTSFEIKSFSKSNYLAFKKEFQNKIDIIIEEQVKMLFSEDYILYLRKMKSGSIDIDFIDTRIKQYKFNKSEFTFSRSPLEWNESVSIKYKGISVAEMQMHSGRSPFKFRLNLPNLMKIIKNEQGV